MAEQACGSWPTGPPRRDPRIAFPRRGGPLNSFDSHTLAYSRQNVTGVDPKEFAYGRFRTSIELGGWGNSHSGATCMGPITIADFYRAEAARCRDRAEKAKSPQRATRWRHVAEDCLRVTAELEAVEGPVHRPAATASSR